MKWVKRAALTVLAIVVLAVAGVYGASEWRLRRDIGVPITPVTVDASPAGIAEGARIAALNGCTICHAGGHGQVFLKIPHVLTINAPSFATMTAGASDAVLARSIREGVSADGRQLFIMPPHAAMAQDDLARLIGYLRTARAAPGDIGRGRSFGPLGRVALLTGGLEGTPHLPLTGPAHRPADSGGYFATTLCLGCHKLDKPNEVNPSDIAPPLLAVAASYGDADFQRLLRTGVGLGGPDLGLMSEVAREGLSHLTDAEIASIHAYLKALAAKQPPQ